MSGPKVGAVALGGAVALSGPLAVAAVAAVALPVVATSLLAVADAVSQNKRKKKNAKRGAENFLNSYQNERNNMIAEVERSEKPAKSLLSNGNSRWNSLLQDIKKIQREVQTETAKLAKSAGLTETKEEVETVLREAETFLQEAEILRKDFDRSSQKADECFNLAKHNSKNGNRTVRQFVTSGNNAADKAVGAINQAVEKARLAKIKFEETLLVILQKGKEEREKEILRQNAQSNIVAAKSEVLQENLILIGDWINDEAVQLLEQHQDKSAKAFDDERYEDASLLAQESVAMYRNFLATALQVKRQFESREIITDAIIAALTDLQYDEPDVNYEPKEGVDNPMFGSLTIFAKSKGETGDMRLAIDLDGKMNLDVAEIPEGSETECHNAITNLQSKIKEVVDFKITDWGRAKEVKNLGSGCSPKQKVQMHDQVKQRE
ncbi:MAG: hypothetical protein LBT09_11630 [Planctomycetaceae bacterium]|jgi:hypothetical protein|nr:hypothetical protein [Planctomycetaceae bacterium]